MIHSLPQLHAGDLLFYNDRWSPVDFIIRVKTWSNVAHVEGYIGHSRSVASRNGIGVGEYDLRHEGLVAILRPIHHFDIKNAMAWFQTVKGEDYDWSGLLCFAFAEWQGSPNKMFCSEFIKHWRLAHLEPAMECRPHRARRPPQITGDELDLVEVENFASMTLPSVSR